MVVLKILDQNTNKLLNGLPSSTNFNINKTSTDKFSISIVLFRVSATTISLIAIATVFNIF